MDKNKVFLVLDNEKETNRKCAEAKKVCNGMKGIEAGARVVGCGDTSKIGIVGFFVICDMGYSLWGTELLATWGLEEEDSRNRSQMQIVEKRGGRDPETCMKSKGSTLQLNSKRDEIK